MPDRPQNAGWPRRAVWRTLLAGVAAAPLTEALADAPAPRVALRGAALSASSSGPELALDFAAPVSLRHFRLAAPPRPRIVFDVPGAQTSSQTLAGLGPIAQVRIAQFTPDTARIVLDLAEPADVREVRAEGGRVLVRIAAGEAGASAHEAEPSSQAPAGPARLIVIDAGHGGNDPGAIGPTGAREKEVNLAAALELRKALRARGFEVALTRDQDTFLPLFERVSRARAAKADLFISLHADASANPDTKGASVYTLSERGGRRAVNVAQAQNWDLDLADRPSSQTVNSILLDLAQRETTNRSAEFAAELIERLAPETPLLRNTHRNAGFAVLLAPDVPAVLLEMGFITNAEDERRLTDPEARRAMMERVADAVAGYFAPRRLVAEG